MSFLNILKHFKSLKSQTKICLFVNQGMGDVYGRTRWSEWNTGWDETSEFNSSEFESEPGSFLGNDISFN